MSEGAFDPLPAEPMAQQVLIENEKVKYSATYMNGIAVAVFAIGGIAPFIGSATTGGSALSATVFAVAGVCWITSFILHLGVLRLLRRLTA